MPLLTFDNQPDDDGGLPRPTLPDRLEIGENNEAWFFYTRSIRTLEMIAKTDGRSMHRVKVHRDFPVGFRHKDIKLTPNQIAAVVHAIKLRD